MKFRHLSEHPLETKTDLLAVCTYADLSATPLFGALDKAVGGRLAAAAKAERFTGKAGQSLTFMSESLAAGRLLLLGAGERSSFEHSTIRELAAQAGAAAAQAGANELVLVLPSLEASDRVRSAQLAAEGALMGTYKFAKYLTGEDAKIPSTLQSIAVCTDAEGGKGGADNGMAAALTRGEAIARAVCLARDFVNEPAEFMTPAQLAQEARSLAAKHASLEVNVLSAKECEALGMGMFLAVGRGSDREPQLVHLSYKPKGKPKKRIALIGKGITFDSGGYSLKPSASMLDMKIDMAGSAAVISAMDAIASIGCEHEVHAVAACCENLVSGRAYKLGDVLQSMDGTTVEINNTDAEGRLTLGDAITYVRSKIEPDEMFDFATLTGACMVALGPYTAGVMSDHEELVAAWLGAAKAAGEDMWRLPLNPRLQEQLKSSIADCRNTGERYGGAITAGLFLKTFAKDTPWVHVDLAGPAATSTARPAYPKGGTGFAVSTIVEYLTT